MRSVGMFWVLLILFTFGVFMWQYFFSKRDKRSARRWGLRGFLSALIALVLVVVVMLINLIGGV